MQFWTSHSIGNDIDRGNLTWMAHSIREWFVMRHGKYTAELGRRLSDRVMSSSRKDLKVFFDHGEKDESKRAVPYFSDYDTSTTLAFVDIAVVNEKSGKVLILCEVEEEGAEPKRIIGDVCNTLLARKVRAGGIDFTLHGCSIVLGIKTRERGMSKVKAKKLVAAIRRMQIGESLHRKKIVLVCASSPDVLMRKVEKKICRIVEESVS